MCAQRVRAAVCPRDLLCRQSGQFSLLDSCLRQFNFEFEQSSPDSIPHDLAAVCCVPSVASMRKCQTGRSNA